MAGPVQHVFIFSTSWIPLLLALARLYSTTRSDSTHLQDKPASFWTPELFMDELADPLVGLGVDGKYDLLGQSWGWDARSTVRLDVSWPVRPL
ncbi:proline iminopeptidase protein [Sanghuangporus baumii]|uniref:Proline iminopeptidase protein n=1 Tax=Sanghuangporus baumii TaxID=108892 RepID=A0A9Q5I5P4_SANBA|nr:proline iminopeptidase protein [Sanghuangporus baumii]